MGRLVPPACDWEKPMRFRAILPAAILAASALATDYARSSETERLANEIANLRALPFGFAAWCEGGTLRMNRKGSGGFRVTDSAICHFVPDCDFVCTTDPNREQQPDNLPVPHCHGLQPPAPDGTI